MSFTLLDTHPHHPTLLRAGAEACWLWVAGFCYSGAHGLDGRLSKDLLHVIYPPLSSGKLTKLSSRLCELGLWIDRESHYEIRLYSEMKAVGAVK